MKVSPCPSSNEPGVSDDAVECNNSSQEVECNNSSQEVDAASDKSSRSSVSSITSNLAFLFSRSSSAFKDEYVASRLELHEVGTHIGVVTLAKGSLLLMVPFIFAFTGIGFQLARKESKKESTGFFVVTPLLVASTLNLISFIATLAAKFGWMDVKKLCSWRYCFVSISGVSVAIRYAFVNIALSQLHASTVFTVMKTSVLYVMAIESFAKHQLPDMARIASVIAVLLTSIAVVTHSMEGTENSASALPIIAACIAAVADAVADFATEFLSTWLCRNSHNTQAELTRFLAADNFWRIMTYGVFLLCEGPTKIAEKGLFYGWSPSILLAISSSMIANPVYRVSIINWGALIANIAGSFDVGAALVFQWLLNLSDFSFTLAIMAAGNASVVIMVCLDALQRERDLVEHTMASTQHLQEQRSSTLVTTSTSRSK